MWNGRKRVDILEIMAKEAFTTDGIWIKTWREQRSSPIPSRELMRTREDKIAAKWTRVK